MISLVSMAALHFANPNVATNATVDNNQVVEVQNVEQKLVKAPLDVYQSYTMVKRVSFNGYKQVIKLPEQNKTSFKNFNEVITSYEKPMKNVINEFNTRKNIDGQFLKWVELPKNQLKKNSDGVSHLDEIYYQARLLKSNTNSDGSVRPLVLLGIGGSRHTAEFLLNMNGEGNTGKVLFYSDIDNGSFNNFVRKNGGDVKKLNFLVASKSGTTFETADGFKRFENALIDSYKKEGLSEEDAILKAQSHFAICTDAKATEKNLRGKIGDKNGERNNYIKELYIHDDVGGRFSMFDDAGLFVLAYANVPKETTARILKSAANTSEKLTKTDNINENTAAKSAIYNVFSRDNGFTLIQHQYFGDVFEGGGENWSKQLYLESLKDFDYMVGTAPQSMHYATEGQFNPANRTSYNTILTIKGQDGKNNYATYTDAIAKTYNETTPLQLEVLEVVGEGEKIKPETIGEYIQSKHFETVYMGMLRRETANIKNDMNKPLAEVVQPSVETYKNKFKEGKYQLKVGE
ncbi:hypothetical protein J6R97_00935 [bacterium]|nr:hypothetical protein [bacterium]